VWPFGVWLFSLLVQVLSHDCNDGMSILHSIIPLVNTNMPVHPTCMTTSKAGEGAWQGAGDPDWGVMG